MPCAHSLDSTADFERADQGNDLRTRSSGGSSADRITARSPSMTGGECGACRAHWPFSFPFSAPLRARLPSTIMANEKFAARPSCCKGGLLRRVEQCVPNCPFSASSAACLLLPPSLAPWRWRPEMSSAQGLLDFFFGGGQKQQHQTSFFADVFNNNSQPPPRLVAASSGPAFCVRSCDGKYFPLM